MKYDVPEDLPPVEFRYLVFTRMPGESYCRQLRSFLLSCLRDVFRALTLSGVILEISQYRVFKYDIQEDLHPLEFLYLVLTRMPGESYCRQLRSLLSCVYDVFRALINYPVC